METLWQDIKYGARMLLRKPGFTAVAVLTLALGIGATTAIFSVVNTVLLQPLPYSEPDRLVRIREFDPTFGTMSTSWPNYVNWRDENTTLDAIASIQGLGYNLATESTPVRVEGMNVTGNLFSMLGVKPLLGRTFTPEEDQPGGEQVALLGHPIWQQRFGGNPEILGDTLSLDGRIYTIIGVMPAGFEFFYDDIEVWTSLGFWADDEDFDDRGNHPGILTFGRLGPGVTLEQAGQDLNIIASRLAEEFPVTNSGHGLKLQFLQESQVRNAKPMLFILLGAVGFVLLIGCANVANLLLAQATTRQKEMAVRTALGAGRTRLIRQLLTESVLMALLGGTTGVLLAYGGLQALKSILPADTPRLAQAGLDLWVLAFALALSLLTGIFFGLAPSLTFSKFNLNDSLKEGGRRSGGTGRHHLRHALVVAEVGLALVLLVGAGLMIRTMAALTTQSPGFNTDNLLTVQISLSSSKYPWEQRETRVGFMQELLPRVRALPGVEAAATGYPLPLSGNGWQSVYVTAENPSPPVDDLPWAENQRVSPGYFQTMGISLQKGRVFTEQDTLDSQPVTIIDDVFAERHWPNENPLGKSLRRGFPDGDDTENDNPWLTVVGVVGHIKLYGVAGEEGAQMYLPQAQEPIRYMKLVVRTRTEPSVLTNAIRQEVAAVDPEQPIYDIQTMDQFASQWVRNQRVSMYLLGVFALLALVLASIGIYGVIAYSVSQRTHEIGIRMALGAQRNSVLKLIIQQGLLLVLMGIALGGTAAFALTRFLESLLFGVSAADPLSFSVFPFLLALVAIVACYVPARRATQVDPMVALRYE